MLMRGLRLLILCLSIPFITQACGGVEIVVTPAPPTEIATFTPIPTFTQRPSIPTKALTQTPTATPEKGPYVAYFVTTSADNVNLRTQPGTLFPVSRLLANGTRLEVLGHTPGGQWLYVLTDSNIYGWVLVSLVNGGQDLGPSPLVAPGNVQTIKGQVLDLAGVPVSGIGFAITQGTGPKAPRSDAETDSTGQFYAYMPLSATGSWLVSYVSVACTSNTMDANCNCAGGKCGKADPDNQTITLPYNATLQFTWK
jgi:uncharacterized protein YraI